jgi:hypothetical protein
MIVVEAGHAHVMEFLLLSCELSIFVAVTVIFQVKSAVMQPILIILSCFAPNLTPVCEQCVLTYSHHFDAFYTELPP